MYRTNLTRPVNQLLTGHPGKILMNNSYHKTYPNPTNFLYNKDLFNFSSAFRHGEFSICNWEKLLVWSSYTSTINYYFPSLFSFTEKGSTSNRSLTVWETSFQKFVFCLQGFTFTIKPDVFFDHKFAVSKSHLKLPIIIYLDAQGFRSSWWYVPHKFRRN